MTETDSVGESPKTGSQRSAARQASLRSHNLGLVLECVTQFETISRADIAQRAGLTRATVSSLVDLLMTADILEWAPALAVGGVGRPASPVRLARGTWAGLGLEIGANHLSGTVVDLAGEQLAVSHVHDDFASLSAAQAARAIAGLAVEVWQRAGTDNPTLRLLGTTLAVPGIVRGDVVLDAPRLNWLDVPFGALLDAENLPDSPIGSGVRLVNEATLAARAESHARVGESFLYVSGGVGVGGALVADGVVQVGKNGFAGELGHLTVDPNGPACRCGSTGCLEQYAGGEALDREDPAIAGAALGIAIADAVNLLDVSTIILGGTLAEGIETLRPALEQELKRRVLAYPWSPVTVEAARIRDFPGLRGAALTPVRKVLGNPEILISHS